MPLAIATIMVPTVQVLARFIREALYWVFWDNELLVPTLLAVITTVTMGRSIAHILQTRYVPKSQRFKAWWHRSVTQMVSSISISSGNICRLGSELNRVERDQLTCAVDRVADDHNKVLYREDKYIACRRSNRRYNRFIATMFTFLFALQCAASSDSPVVALQHVAISFNANSTSDTGSSSDHTYDAGSYLIAIDNCSSRCITNSLTDFVAPPQATDIRVKGVGGYSAATYVGTVRWSIEDDEGKIHHFDIPNTYFNADVPYRLLSPQHWAQTQGRSKTSKSETFYDSVNLIWDAGRHRRRIPLDGATNVAVVRSAQCFDKFHAFCAELAQVPADIDDTVFMCYPAAISDDESSDDKDDHETDDTSPVLDRRHPICRIKHSMEMKNPTLNSHRLYQWKD